MALAKLNPVDVVCIIGTCIAEVLYLLELVVGRSRFVAMLDEFGGVMPHLTQWMLYGNLAWILAGVPSVLLVAGFVFDRGFRTGCFIAASVIAALNVVAFIVAVYLPLLTIAGNIN